MRNLLVQSALALGILPCITQADDNWALDNEIVSEDYFIINDESWKGIRAQLHSERFSQQWSDTIAEVTWTDTCEVTLEAKIFLPRLGQPELEDVDSTQEFASLVSGLREFEERQLQLWKFYAEEIKRRSCPIESDEIWAYWQEQLIVSEINSNFGLEEVLSRKK